MMKGIGMLKRFIGSQPVEVYILGERYGVVENGECVAVPDEIASQGGWSDELWQDVAPAPAKKRQGNPPAPAKKVEG
jgi:hypothetical protein